MYTPASSVMFIRAAPASVGGRKDAEKRENIKMRRSIPIVAAALGLGLALTACSGDTGSKNPTTTPAPQATTSEAPKLSGELNVWVDEQRILDLKEVAADFEKENGVKINMTQKAFGDIKKDFAAQATQDGAPDIIVGANDWTGELVASGLIAKVSLGSALDELSDTGKAAFTIDGGLYAVPYATENIALIRNNKLVKETPATWDELIKQNETTKAKYPAVLQQNGEDGDPFHMYPLMASFGAHFFALNEDGTYKKESGLGGENGAKFATWLNEQGKNGNGWLSGDINGDVAADAFRKGETPYIITGPWNVAGAEGRFVESGMDVSVLTIPSAGGQTASPLAGFQGFFVNATSKNQIAANSFVSYIGTSDVQTKLYEAGKRIPVNTVSAGNVTDPIVKAFIEVGKTAVPQPNYKEMDGVWGTVGSAQGQIIAGKVDDPAKLWADVSNTVSGLF